MTPAENLARARAWIERALEAEGVLYREGGKPYLSGKGEIIIEACAEAYAAGVQAKGEPALTILRDPSLMGKSVLPRNPDAVWTVYVGMVEDALRADAADVPEVPR